MRDLDGAPRIAIARIFGGGSGMRWLLPVLGAAMALGAVSIARAEAITRLPTQDKVVALTFDACEAGKVTHLDHGVSDYLVANRIPFTIFMGGRFARDNQEDVRALGELPFVEIENHSWSHRSDMRRLSSWRVVEEVIFAEAQIALGSGRDTRYFRFPGGKSDARTIELVEWLGYKIVHWRWPEGDPDRHVTAAGMLRETLARVKPGDILIFHINGNGVHTAEAMPQIVDALAKRGYRFVLLEDYLDPPAIGDVSILKTPSSP